MAKRPKKQPAPKPALPDSPAVALEEARKRVEAELEARVARAKKRIDAILEEENCRLRGAPFSRMVPTESGGYAQEWSAEVQIHALPANAKAEPHAHAAAG